MVYSVSISEDGKNFRTVFNAAAASMQIAEEHPPNKSVSVSEDGNNFRTVFNAAAASMQIADEEKKGNMILYVSTDGASFQPTPIYNAATNFHINFPATGGNKEVYASTDGASFQPTPIYNAAAKNFFIKLAPITPPIIKPADGHVKPGGWGGNQDPSTWRVVSMDDDPTLFKIVDNNNTNIAHRFATQQEAQQFIDYEKSIYQKQGPSIRGSTGGQSASNGIMIMAKIRSGEEVTNFEVERSTHDQSKEKNIKRDSIYAKPKMSENKTVNLAQYGYIKTKLSKDDQIDFKRCGGGHGGKGDSKETRQGRCYAVGVMVRSGNPTKGFLAKEYPHHSDTPKFENEIKYGAFQEIPDVNDKLIGLQTIGYATQQGTYKILCYIDKSVMDKNPEDLDKPPNNWELFFTAEDNGNWDNGEKDGKGGDPYLTNQGIANDGEAMFLYGRIDHVTYDTKVKFAGACEIEAGS